MKIWIPICSIGVALMVGLTIAGEYWNDVLDTYVNRGDKVITNVEGVEDWDTDYYEEKYSSTTGESGSQLAAAKVAEEISDEGTVLLKNNGVLPLQKNSSVAPFGYRYYNPFYGGSGSGSVVTTDAYVVTPESALASNFNVEETFEVTDSTNVRKYYYDTNYGDDVLYFFDYTNSYNGSDQSIYEFDSSVYETGFVSSDSTAIVFLGRSGGENNDLWTIPYNRVGDVGADDAGTSAGTISNVKNAESTSEVRHALDLMPEEEDALELAKKTCENVVVIINSSNAMELGDLADDDDIDAIMWIGGPGAKGFQSMSDILCGSVNPSGSTVDIYVRDVTQDPTYKNIGDVDGFAYTNTDGLGPMGSKQHASSRQESNPMEYIEYEEGVYMGYKYYETAYDEKLTGFTYGELDEYGATKTAGQVVYPFGYGLSYTTFSEEIISFEGNEEEVTMTVRVQNTGNVAGKDTVQAYFTAPYTEIDKRYGIEKPTAVLAAFGKTKELQPGATADVTLTFGTDDMASYSYRHDNGDGTTGCYMLDAGEYTISLRENSHDIIDSRTFEINDTIWFDNDNPRQSEKDAQAMLDDEGNSLGIPAAAEQDTDAEFVAATNNFEDSNTYMDDDGIQSLTRSVANGLDVDNLEAGEKYKAAPDWVVEKLQPYDVNTDTELGNVEGSHVYHDADPVSKEDNGQTLSNYRGLSYYDSSWDELLNQIDYSSDQLLTLMFKDQYAVNPLDEVGLSSSTALDGPQGLTLSSDLGTGDYGTCAWSTEPVVAATFNVELAYEYGEAVGQEALTLGCTGWYAPGMDTHRTAFSGRNFEYYSEDGVLAGKIAARVVSGAGDQGLCCYIKHFALNDNDSNRANICVWANEQAIREIYLRPFEIVVKKPE